MWFILTVNVGSSIIGVTLFCSQFVKILLMVSATEGTSVSSDIQILEDMIEKDQPLTLFHQDIHTMRFLGIISIEH